MDLTTNIQFLKGVGEARAKLFAKLGVRTVGELLSFYPRAYEDWSRALGIHEAPIGESCCVKATLSATPTVSRTSGGGILVKTMATDGASLMGLTFFNNKYVANQLSEGEEYLFFGKVGTNIYGGREMLSPKFAKADIKKSDSPDACSLTPNPNKSEKHLQKSLPFCAEFCGLGSNPSRMRPVYHQTEKLNSRSIETCVQRALEGLEGNIAETLPRTLIEKYRLMPLYDALKALHFPRDERDVDAARRRLIFEELLFLQLGLFKLRESRRETGNIALKEIYTDEFTAALPYTLTSAQSRAIAEALADMRSPRPMNRLLQGDVGSGKTAVAAALIYNMAGNGFQSALMAPTEVLAEQHYRTFSSLFNNSGIRFALLTGSTPAKQKREIKESLREGGTDFIIGTHALIQDSVAFKSLGLVITDEQHRFGVAQRAALTQKGDHPHVFVMSATPIPRTLGLIIYGDLDISVLDELPPGRTPIKTYRVGTNYRERIYKFIKKQLDGGRQAYIICPLIEEGELDLVPALQYAKQLRSDVFRDYQVGLLHGRMKSAEKDAVMRDFDGGNIQLLVSTVVVEVGVDVPNATIMAIENAERFGLSQLHQLRGRVGRGEHESTCILISDAQNEETVKRLDALCATNDGFKIAEEDFKARGPGDFFGSRQHGLPEMKIASFANDTKILYAAQDIANGIIKDDPLLLKNENLLLRQGVDKLFESEIQGMRN